MRGIATRRARGDGTRSRRPTRYTRPMDDRHRPPICRRNLTPVLGRYFEREWSHGEGHRLYDTDGKAYLDFANGIAVTALGHAHPRVTAAIHAQVDKLIGPVNALGFTEPISRLADGRSPRRFPDAARLGHVPELRLGGDRRRRSSWRAGSPGRPGIIAFRGGFHGRTFGATSVTTLDAQLPDRLRAAAAGRLPRAVPGAPTATSTATRTAAVERRHGRPARRCLDAVDPAVGGRVRSSSSRSRARAATRRRRRRSCASCGRSATSTGSCSSPTRSRRGYGRTGRMWAFEHAGIVPDVVVRGQGDRERPAAVGDRLVARAPGALGPRRPRLDVRRQPGRLRGGRGRARDDPRRGPRRERRRRAAPS